MKQGGAVHPPPPPPSPGSASVCQCFHSTTPFCSTVLGHKIDVKYLMNQDVLEYQNWGTPSTIRLKSLMVIEN